MVRMLAAREAKGSTSSPSDFPVETIVKLFGINCSSRPVRLLAIAAVPIAVAGAIMGPAAGTAHAMEPEPGSCLQLLSAADETWDIATEYELNGDAALERGDVTTWAQDRVLENYFNAQGDAIYDEWTYQGCH